MVSIGACLYILHYYPAEQATAIALWLTAQLWIIAAAFPPRRAVVTAGLYPRLFLGLILLGTVVTRFWEIGYYPDNVQTDHNFYGLALIRLLRGEWEPFFIMDPLSRSTFSRPWLVPAAGVMRAFGADYWALRVPAAISAVVMVWGTYLLGKELFNQRVGLIASLLTSVNQVLLVYLRQPYVIESTAPLLLALYCAVAGMKRGSRFHWCAVGVLSGWAMLSIR